ncbi:FkbM family methyltransferase [Halopenitus sp. H-Gu1]|uniref:FkbM family methyltransferase n=1 Tax=Halopenitus sp. H-Gu1 TaxID=3242697 RepID=UPI00359E2E4B
MASIIACARQAIIDAAYRSYYRLNDLNHEHEIWASPKRAAGVRFRSYEPLPRHCRDELLEALCSGLGPAEVVYDVGANTGVYTLAAAATRPDVRVIAFEPDPRVVEHLRQNVACNSFEDRVTVRTEGVGDETGTATFHRSSYDELGSFRPGNAAAWTADVTETTTVPIVRLDDVEAPPPDHLKIDVEGFGREVLEGAAETIETHRPTVYFEPHVVDAGGTDYEVDWLRDRLDTLGYGAERLAEGWVFRP